MNSLASSIWPEALEMMPAMTTIHGCIGCIWQNRPHYPKGHKRHIMKAIGCLPFMTVSEAMAVRSIFNTEQVYKEV